MRKINILDSAVYNLIAAGEVVERPASVIKELVENSLDAGARQITVEIKKGGIDYIRVSDDGEGITKSDMHKVFLPHSTSKISSAEDLNAILTLGFRGEALASISAVSQSKVSSRTAGNDLGYTIDCDSGRLGDVYSIGMPFGTTVTVRNLFKNLPARAKFLKKPAQEESAVSNLMLRIILSRPEISFKYIADDNLIYITQGKGMTDALISVYGKDILNKLFYVNNTTSDITIEGYVSKPAYNRPNRTYQTLMINGRYIVNSAISAAVQKACADGLMKRQYPMYVLNINTPPDFVDINVHPNKLDVRFVDSGLVFRLVYGAVKSGLDLDIRQQHLTYLKTAENIKSSLPQSEERAIQGSFDSRTEGWHVDQDNLGATATADVAHYQSEYVNNDIKDRQTNNKESGQSKLDYNLKPDNETAGEFFNSTHTIGTKAQGVRDDGGRMFGIMQRLEKMRSQPPNAYNENNAPSNSDYIQANFADNHTDGSTVSHDEASIIHTGTLFGTYLIVQQANDNVIFIDQHAAHERLLYDKLMAETSTAKDGSIQDLLIPYTFDVNHIENDFLLNILEQLNELGFGIESFGGLSYKISYVPLVLSDINLTDFVNIILKESTTFTKVAAEDLLKDKLAMAACKAAVKAGDRLKKEDVLMLLSELRKNNTVPLCPHGRPILIKFTKEDIEKWFKRRV